MRFSVALFVLLVCATMMTFAQMPPLIDRELFFDDPEYSGAQLSPNGKYITFLRPFKGVRNIWVKGSSEPFEKARPITADTTRPVTSYFWTRDSRYVLYVQDKGGDENYHIYAVDPAASGDPVPPARDLTPFEKVRAMIYDVPRTTPDKIVIGLNDRRADLHDVYRLTISTGERVLMRKNDNNVIAWILDRDAQLRLAMRQTADGGTELLRADQDSLMSIYRVTAEESCSPVRFTPDGGRFYLVTNKGDALDKTRLEVFDLGTGMTAPVDSDPKNEVDFGSALFSDVNDELLATIYVGDRVRLYPKQKAFAADYAKMEKAFPNGQLSITSTTADERVFLVGVSSDTDPGSIHVFDRNTGKATLLYRSRPKLPSQHLATMKPVRYKGRDGMTIPAYLTLPKGIPAKKLPVIMVIHGGPWVRDMWGYNSIAQFLANRGYAVFQPNYRGSTGYGKKFLNAGNKQWGIGSMQHDITDGVKYLVTQGIADPKRVAIFGGSYGGYATLAGVAFTPDLYAAGVSYVGPSNIITLLKTIPPYWAPMKKTFDVRVGNMDNPEERKMLDAASPLNSAKNIKAPLLVIQGANDPRVKKAESDQIVVALRDLGRPVEYMVAPDEGHGFVGRENRMAAYTAMEKFFSKHLGGRYQESILPEVKTRLDALTVDVATVTLAAVPKAGGPAPDATVDPSKVKAETLHYTTLFSAMGQKITINSTRTIQPTEANGKKLWRIVDLTSGMMGSGADTVDLDSATLHAVHRSSTQGPAKIALNFTDGGVKGSVASPRGDMQIDAPSSGPIVSDGSGIDLYLGAVPFADGYRAGINMFDMMSRKVQRMIITVAGKEKTTTPAGEFDTHKVSLNPADGDGNAQMYWVATDRRIVVRAEMELPAAMGGGKAVTELAK